MQLSRDNNWSETPSLTSKRETPSRRKSTPSTLKLRKLKAQFQKSWKSWKTSKLKSMSSKNIKRAKMKFWVNLTKISKESAIRKSNTGMRRISLESKRMNSTINTTTLLSNTANSNISFKISNGWLRWKVNFKNLLKKNKSVKKITKKELLTEKQETKIKREEMKNMLKRKRKRPREKSKPKKMPSRMRDKTRSTLWINLTLFSRIQALVQIWWPLKFNNVMLF